MSRSLNSLVSAQLGWNWRDEQDFALLADDNRLEYRFALASGTGAGRADAVWYVPGDALAQGVARRWTLTALPRSVFGGQITQSFAAIKALLLLNRAESGGLLVLGGDTETPWWGPFGAADQTLRLPPGAALLLSHAGIGWPVDAQTCNLRLKAEGGAVGYDLALIGIAA
ncbi:MAG: hypothetical protein GYA33_16815 [Thermogutta sp.]|nr:hypothetical protein [Thermogutta sp.]